MAHTWGVLGGEALQWEPEAAGTRAMQLAALYPVKKQRGMSRLLSSVLLTGLVVVECHLTQCGESLTDTPEAYILGESRPYQVDNQC